ncbi:MAG: hypothetical protein EOO88_26260 [Pedobacter sp.]|nr:MAG: hypothetical protein EOO88_26260 [Pedobacter sp.]
MQQKLETRADSTNVDKIKEITYFYGNARIVYDSFELDADFIRYDKKNNVIFARGRKDSKGRYVGRPIFKMDKEGSSIADSLFYNTETGKGTVFNTYTEQEGSYFSGGQSKKQPDDELHIKGVTYSTCNLPHPHRMRVGDFSSKTADITSHLTIMWMLKSPGPFIHGALTTQQSPVTT